MRLAVVLIVLACPALAAAQSPPNCGQWSTPFYGSHDWNTQRYNGHSRGNDGVMFADVNGDHHADLIGVSNEVDGVGFGSMRVTARLATFSRGGAFVGFGPNVDLFANSFDIFSMHRVFFGDINGDDFADAVLVGSDRVRIRINNGGVFGPPIDATSDAFSGTYGTYLADVDGDHRHDLIAISTGATGNLVRVRRSTGTGFGPVESWGGKLLFGAIGDHATAIADVTGDGRADLVMVTTNGIYVRASTGSSFGYPAASFTGGVDWHGSNGTYFADMNGDGKADAIGMFSGGPVVRLSTGSSFLSATNWLVISTVPYTGNAKVAFAPVVSGPGFADLIVINANLPVYGHANQGTTYQCIPI